MRLLVLCGVVLLAGCLDGPGPASVGSADPATDLPATAPCTPANKSNDGTRLNDLYVVGGEAWRETNGVENLQRSETCEGPADTRIAP